MGETDLPPEAGSAGFDAAELARRIGVAERDVHDLASWPELGLAGRPGEGRRRAYDRPAARRIAVAAALKRAGVATPEAVAASAWTAAAAERPGADPGRYGTERDERLRASTLRLELADGRYARIVRAYPRPGRRPGPRAGGAARPDPGASAPRAFVRRGFAHVSPWHEFALADAGGLGPVAVVGRIVVRVAVDLGEVERRLGPPRPVRAGLAGPGPAAGGGAGVASEDGSDPRRPRPRFPTDVSDEEWERIVELVREPAGRPATVDRRAIVDAILHKLATGRPWRDLPDVFPPWPTVHTAFWRWKRRLIWPQLVSRLDVGRDRPGVF